jgi:transaldolase
MEVKVMKTLVSLIEHGQSFWIDNLTRSMIQNGELKRRAIEEGLRGVTSNPAIFNKAISKSNDYKDQIEKGVAAGRPVRKIYEELITTDARNACDVLRSVYDQTNGKDGFVSLEVSPYLAYDTEGSIREARELYKIVDRPNLFIKIPGTRAGVPAIEELLFEGININITLLFSIESYEAVAQAYLRAVERRARAGRSLHNIASVASFFLSRIDTLVDELLSRRSGQTSAGEPDLKRLLGKAAVANAKLAYQSFKQILQSERWKTLEK